MNHNLKELKVREKAIDLMVDVYKASADFPTEEKYGLISQMRRSKVSVPSNIAEGAARNTAKESGYFLGISNGSSFELMTQVLISTRLELISDETANLLLSDIDEVHKITRAQHKRIIPKKSNV
jgi:four helix bundle protein